jgi:hypothetical protein
VVFMRAEMCARNGEKRIGYRSLCKFIMREMETETENGGRGSEQDLLRGSRLTSHLIDRISNFSDQLPSQEVKNPYSYSST